MPKIIRVIGIEIPVQEFFTEKVTEETLEKIPIIKKMVLEEITLLLGEKYYIQKEIYSVFNKKKIELIII